MDSKQIICILFSFYIQLSRIKYILTQDSYIYFKFLTQKNGHYTRKGRFFKMQKYCTSQLILLMKRNLIVWQ